jgi:hypothetical protein
VSKNKFLLIAFSLFVVALSVSTSFWLFLAASVVAFILPQKSRKKTIFLRAFKAVAFFSGLTFAGNFAAAYAFGTGYEPLHMAVLFCRAFSITFLTLATVDMVGIFNIFSAKNELSIFFVMLFSKIESLSKEMNDFRESARSRGMRMQNFSDSLTLLSIIITALLLKSTEGFRASAEALRSRGQSA